MHSDKSPGWKFSEQEMRGIPLRVEIGPKDIEAGQCVLVRRDTREKRVVALTELTQVAGEMLEQMQNDMYARAKAFMDSHMTEARTYDEFKDAVANKPGFVEAMWCGDEACELKIKEDTTATSRLHAVPAETHASENCVCCGKPAKSLVYWGKAVI